MLPYSHLVLYAKGWLRFPWIKETDYYRELKVVLNMCGYYVTTEEDVLNHILNAVDNLKEFYSKRGISFIWGLNTYMELIGETKKYQRIYDIKTFELALILHCISCLRQIDLHKLNCLVYNIDYRVYRVKLETSKEAMTYKECQKHFFKSFSDMLSGQSYDEQWWIKNLKSIR